MSTMEGDKKLEQPTEGETEGKKEKEERDVDNILTIDQERKMDLPENFKEFLFPELALASEEQIDMNKVEKYYPNFTPIGKPYQKIDVLSKLKEDDMLRFTFGLREREALFEKGTEFFLHNFEKDKTLYFWKDAFAVNDQYGVHKKWGSVVDRWRKDKDNDKPEPLIFVPTLSVEGCKETIDEPDKLIKEYRCLNGEYSKYDHYNWGVSSPYLSRDRHDNPVDEKSGNWA